MRSPLVALACVILVPVARGINFDFEADQLTDDDVVDFSAVAFGTSSQQSSRAALECLTFPGNADWPTDEEWNQLNTTLGGALLKPTPPGAVCYKGAQYDAAKCRSLVLTGGFSRVYLDDPVSVLTRWTEGDTCPAMLYPTGNCTQGGFPVYVVKATTVRHIQAGINFARNKNIRLVVK
jgi:hypothetical protein